VKNDPGRLAKWQADQDKDKADKRAHNDSTVFEATGCDHTQLYSCRPHHANGAVYPNIADCFTLDKQ
jgi:hypothetical protein